MVRCNAKDDSRRLYDTLVLLVLTSISVFCLNDLRTALGWTMLPDCGVAVLAGVVAGAISASVNPQCELSHSPASLPSFGVERNADGYVRSELNPTFAAQRHKQQTHISLRLTKTSFSPFSFPTSFSSPASPCQSDCSRRTSGRSSSSPSSGLSLPPSPPASSCSSGVSQSGRDTHTFVFVFRNALSVCLSVRHPAEERINSQ